MNRDLCEKLVQNPTINPLTNRRIDPNTKNGVYQKLKKECEQILARRLQTPQRSPPRRSSPSRPQPPPQRSTLPRPQRSTPSAPQSPRRPSSPKSKKRITLQDCENLRTNPTINPLTGHKINPNAKNGVYQKLIFECEKLQQQKLKQPSTPRRPSTPKAGPSRAARTPSPQRRPSTPKAGPSRAARTPSPPKAGPSGAARSSPRAPFQSPRPGPSSPAGLVLSPRARINKYQYSQILPSTVRSTVGKVLGEGTFGAVKQYSIGNSMFVVKEIKGYIDPVEMYILSAGRHPNLLCSAKIFMKGKNINYLLPLANGSLDKLPRGLPFEIKQKLLTDIIQGLSFLHERMYILHLDLKPNNILYYINEQGEYLAKVADFGLARFIGNAQKLTSRSEVVTTLYKSPYLSAVREKSNQIIGRYTDTWSLGIIALELFFDFNIVQVIVEGNAPNEVIQLGNVFNRHNYTFFTNDPMRYIIPIIETSQYTDDQKGLLVQFFGAIFDPPIPQKDRELLNLLFNKVDELSRRYNEFQSGVNRLSQEDFNLLKKIDSLRPTITALTKLPIFTQVVAPDFDRLGYVLEPPLDIIAPISNIRGLQMENIIGANLPERKRSNIERFIDSIYDGKHNRIDYSEIIEYLPIFSNVIQTASINRLPGFATNFYESYINIESKNLENAEIQGQYFSCIPGIDELIAENL